MFTNPHLSTQLASDRQRGLLAGAERHRRVAQFRDRPRESRHVIRASQALLGTLRGIAQRRTVLPV
jgi:hypothetical protein